MERAEAEKAVDAIFKDLRDRRFLKWLFADPEGGSVMIARFQDGEELWPLDGEVQQEIREEWISILVRQR